MKVTATDVAVAQVLVVDVLLVVLVEDAAPERYPVSRRIDSYDVESLPVMALQIPLPVSLASG